MRKGNVNIDDIMSDIKEREELEAKQSSDYNDEYDADDDDYPEYGQGNGIITKGPKPIGTVERFFKRINVAALYMDSGIKVGDTIEIRGKSTVRLTVESMQIEHRQVESASAGDSVGIKVPIEVSEGDTVYLIE